MSGLSSHLVRQPSFKRPASILLLGCANLAVAAVAQTVPPQSYTLSPLGVNLQDGGFTYNKTDLSIGNLTYTRFLIGGKSSLAGTNFTAYVAIGTETAVAIGQSSMRFSTPTSGTNYLPWDNAAFGSTLTHSSGGYYTLTNRNGDVYSFGLPSGATLLTQINYAEGNRTDLFYNVNNQLRAIVSNQGYAIVLEYPTYSAPAPTTVCGYNAAQTYVDVNSTCSGSSLVVSYGYSGTDLTSVTDVRGNTIYYTYDANHRLTCVSIPNSSSCKIANTYWGSDPMHIDIYPSAVKYQDTATGQRWSYEYSNQRNFDPKAPPSATPGTTTYGNFTDPLGGGGDVTFYGYTPQVFSDGIGRTTNFFYNGPDLQTLTYPEGNTVNYTYNDRGMLAQEQRNPKASSGSPTLTMSTAYPLSDGATYPSRCDPSSYNAKVCNKPLSKTDANGNVTNYTYDSNSGMIASELGPAVGGVRPLTTYSYTAIYGGIMNASSGVASAATPVWLLTREGRCKTGSSCTGTSDEVVTTYEYGASGTAGATLLRGKVVDPGGLSLRTCYVYDARGNRVAETQPRAGLSSCS